MPGRVPQKLISALGDGNSEAQVLPVQWENKKLAQILNLHSSVCSDDGNVPVLGEPSSARSGTSACVILGDLMCTLTANSQGDQTSILLDHYPYPNSNPTLGTGPRRKVWGVHRLKDCTFCASPGAERGGFGDAAHGSNKTRIKAKRLKKNDYQMEQGAGAAHPLHGAMSCSR